MILLDYTQAYITGPREVTVSYGETRYNVSMGCPSNALCMWTLDDESVSISSDTSLTVRFRPDQIGNHVLSYGAIVNNTTYQAFVSTPLTVRSARESGSVQYAEHSPI